MENTVDWIKYEQASEDEKVNLLKTWAEEGDAKAQFKLGVIYSDENSECRNAEELVGLVVFTKREVNYKSK